MSSHTNSKPESTSMTHTKDAGVERFTSANPPSQRPVSHSLGAVDQHNPLGHESADKPVTNDEQPGHAGQAFKPRIKEVEDIMQPAMNSATQTAKSTRRHRQIAEGVYVDHYDVVTAFKVTCPAQISIIEKLLLASQLEPSQAEAMLLNVQDDIARALELHRKRQQLR